ncbi:TetR/AcrR family transcriptional regulator [Actinoallomurus sp. CA-150999]|uniref:TetR/AcrR family transcriptional regulator n=1 Tax=Actinoallomurus sp. CA-150999 TaxID=3239887 RepID=UPI003D8AF05D
MPPRTYTSEIRSRHAADTRRVIIKAARELFARQGYARTSVAEVAAAAGVAVNTVYTSVGGKSALILAMTEDSAADAVGADSLERIATLNDPREILRVTAEGTGTVQRRQQKTLAILLDNRNADPDIAAAADLATRFVQERFGVIAERLIETGGVRPELARTQVEQTLWFYFGFDAWRSVRGMGWTWPDATQWLATQAAHALLPPAA